MPVGVRIKFSLLGRKQLDETLVAYDARARDMRPVWRTLVRELWAFEREVFARRGAHEGLQAWANLRKRYWRRKMKQFPAAGILVRTGDLVRSLTGRGTGAIARMYADRLIFGTAIPYAIYHQTGYRARDGSRVPARPPLRLSERMKTRIVERMRGHLWRER